jgi:hypothetical protein
VLPCGSCWQLDVTQPNASGLPTRKTATRLVMEGDTPRLSKKKVTFRPACRTRGGRLMVVTERRPARVPAASSRGPQRTGGAGSCGSLGSYRHGRGARFASASESQPTVDLVLAADDDISDSGRRQRESCDRRYARLPLTAFAQEGAVSERTCRAACIAWKAPRRSGSPRACTWCDSAVPRAAVKKAASGYQRLPSPYRLLFSELYPFASEHRVARIIGLERQGTLCVDRRW